MQVRFNSVDDVRGFVDSCDGSGLSLQLSDGRLCVNAASILGVFSLSLFKGVDLIIPPGDAEHQKKVGEFLCSIDTFIVKGGTNGGKV